MFPLTLLLLLVLPFTHSLNTTIECLDANDYYHLMYKICSNQVLCREIYYIDLPHHNNSILVEQDFHRFRYQLSLIQFYPVNDTNPSSHHHHWDGQPLVELVYPLEWQPYITILYDNSLPVSCSDSFNLTTPSEFIYISLALLQIYKQYISNEHYCVDYNERPIFNPETGEFICFCTNEKLCNSQSSYRQMLLYITSLTLVTVLLYVCMTYIGTFLLLNLGGGISAIRREPKKTI